MKYELKIPAIHGDVVPLWLVAETMAIAASTAYGKTPPHKPIYDYQLPTQIRHLLNEAREGRLHVCNQDGVQNTVDEIIAAAKNSGDLSEVSRYLVEPDWEKLERENPPVAGVQYLSRQDVGATEIDWDTTNIFILYSKLHCLNKWGEPRGDSFLISDEPVGWKDERGYMNRTNAPAAKGEAGAGTSPSGDDWKVQARAIADKIALERWGRGEREITARNICEAVATELGKDSTTHGNRGERSSGTVRNQALKKEDWKFIPPTGTNGTSGTNE